MKLLDTQLVFAALKAIGTALGSRSGVGSVRLVLAGGTAGLLGGLFRSSRSTGDCDVLWMGDDDTWANISQAAAEVGRRLDLPPTWLNRDCSMYAWMLPLGWRQRCEPVGVFGPLEVVRLGRQDLIASKIMSSPRRPQDIADLRDIGPTPGELVFVEEHLDRLEAEHPDRETFEPQRDVLQALRGMQ